MMFTVDDLDDVVGRLRAHGAELLRKIAQYKDVYRLWIMRGPEAMIIGLAEQLRHDDQKPPAGRARVGRRRRSEVAIRLLFRRTALLMAPTAARPPLAGGAGLGAPVGR